MNKYTRLDFSSKPLYNDHKSQNIDLNIFKGNIYIHRLHKHLNTHSIFNSYPST